MQLPRYFTPPLLFLLLIFTKNEKWQSSNDLIWRFPPCFSCHFLYFAIASKNDSHNKRKYSQKY